AGHTGLDAEEVIRRHTAAEYTVYAIGFCPGFPYLGYLPPELSGVPRLPAPRARGGPGRGGPAGRPTGVSPRGRPGRRDLSRPSRGGGTVLGGAPLVWAAPAAGYFRLRVGAGVRSRGIEEDESRRLHGQRLPERL